MEVGGRRPRAPGLARRRRSVRHHHRAPRFGCGGCEPPRRAGESNRPMPETSGASSRPDSQPRPWQRLSVRLACLLAAVTLLAVAAVGGVTYKRYQRELADTVGTQLLNIARVTALAVDPSLHGQAQRSLDAHSPAHLRLKRELLTIQNELLL